MTVGVADEARPELRMRLTAETASVPGARRFVRDGLVGWGRRALVEDAALCVTEMAANAALHSGSAFMHVVVHDLADTVRVAVEDEGALVPVEAVRPRLVPDPPADAGDEDVPTALLLDGESMTGRGLAMVSMVAEAWGVADTPHGRRVWADLAGDGADHPVRPPLLDGAGGEPAHPSLPGDWRTVRVPRCPVQLALRADQHLDDLVRELQLAGADGSPPPELADLVQAIERGPVWARHTGRRIAQEAAAAGLELIDLEMTMPRAMSAAIRELLRVGEAADEVCREHGLLTTASTAEIASLRSWITECVVDQLERDVEPRTFADWLAARA